MDNFAAAIDALTQGKVIAYPTEGVFGVGCDPDNPQAIQSLLAIKQRPVEKGLILIAASYKQIKDYIDETQLSEAQLAAIRATWPGPVTWVVPASDKVSSWVSGQFDSVAVRVTDHPLVQQLCQQFGKPITSTSANLTGQPPCKTHQEVVEQLGNQPVTIVEGETGGRANPTEIRDAKTGQVFRQG
ncbi:L-threonylcarbamoyladenylate synthase [Vibrio sp. WXL210]|uniref:L-threonylcarbamoyladenylate synthase n=1 Tax=Vibrio sp. WXL210 TaxID=3450709 RepID=UPI003EC510E3